VELNDIRDSSVDCPVVSQSHDRCDGTVDRFWQDTDSAFNIGLTVFESDTISKTDKIADLSRRSLSHLAFDLLPQVALHVR
jgi:hypothetical protein